MSASQLDTVLPGSSTDAGIGSRLLAGSTTGALAVAVAQPTDVVKVRFQAQARAGGGQRYQSTVDAYKTIAREEGFRGLWKGVYRMFLLSLFFFFLPPIPWSHIDTPSFCRNLSQYCP